ncbi:MAG: lysylphosphatidylglycerol synthase transmembrane domain-containing protein [Saprospiraceae bacterium]
MNLGWIKPLGRFLLFAGIGVGVFAWVFHAQSKAYQAQCALDGIAPADCRLIDKLLHDFTLASPGWMLAVAAAFTFSVVLRAWRMQMLMRPLGYDISFGNSFFSILLGYFANLGLPRMGEVVRAGALARNEGAPPAQVMGALVVDRLMDFVCLGLVVALTLLFEADTIRDFVTQGRQAQRGGGLGWAPVLAAIALCGAAGLWMIRKRLMRHPLVLKGWGLVQGFQEGLRSVFRMANPGRFFLYSIGIWLMFYLQCWFNLLAFPPTAHLGMGAAMMVFVLGTLGMVVPSPGGMGSFHALAVAALALYGISGGDAFSYANIAFFTIQIGYNLLGGAAALMALPRLKKRSATNQATT